VLEATDRGMPRNEIVGTFVVPLAHPEALAQAPQVGRRPRAGASTERRRRILATAEERRAVVWVQLEEHDDVTLKRHCELWEEGRGVRVSIATMSRAVRDRLGRPGEKIAWLATRLVPLSLG
jgi:hypothetical protein